MNGRRDQFNWPHQIRGNTVSTRFGIRKEFKEQPVAREKSIFTYASAGRGQAGESGRMGQGGGSF